jgi:hypothetical protein
MMNFPITRARLQTITKEFEDSQIQIYINDTVEYVKTLIIVKAYSNKNPTLKLTLPIGVSRQIYNENKYVMNATFFPHSDVQKNIHLPVIVERLTVLFPDVSFQVDPLNTYLLIDWS